MPDDPLVISRLIFGKPIERLAADERAELDYLLGLDARDADLYDRLAAEFPEEDGDATRH
jgi:hypothetical protein